MSRLHLLFKIGLFHQYYDQGIMKEIRLVADEKTQKIIDRFRLQILQDDGEFSVYQFSDRQTRPFVQSLIRVLEGQPFVFKMISENPYFLIITDVPVNWKGQLDYSSRDAQPENHQGQTALALSLQLVQPPLWGDGMIGKVSLYPRDLFDEDGQVKNPLFHIQMKARRTHWIYTVFNRNQIKLHNPLVTNHQGIEFSPPQAITFANGEGAFQFTSGTRTFPFQETSKYLFDLVNSIHSGTLNKTQGGKVKTRTLIKGLPVPQGNRIQIQTDKSDPYVSSEMYVYL